MKLFTLLVGLLPLAAGSPARRGPMGGTLITDPERLSRLEASHKETLQALRNRDPTYVSLESLKNIDPAEPGNERRFVVFGLAGVAIIELVGALLDLSGELGERLLSALTTDSNEIWYDTSYCRLYYQTQGGANEVIKSYDRGSSAATETNNFNTGWNDPENNDPPIFYFANDGGIGEYSVQFTATDTYAWDGINGTTKCYIQGLCNPEFVFYHDGYNVVLDAWLSQGSVTACQYGGESDCQGMCYDGVLNQFESGGVEWGGNCAVPCWDDGGEDWVTEDTTTARIMVAGDSISHGMDDDWTWRYRLEDWLATNQHDTVFVGAFQGTHGAVPTEGVYGSPPTLPGETAEDPVTLTGVYASGVPNDFTTSSHSSWWGRQAAQTKETIYDWVLTDQPNYLLLLLGFNDLGWWVSDAAGLLASMEELIANARAAKSDINILVGNVVDRLFLEGRDDLVESTATYNSLLLDAIPTWSTSDSPVALVDVNSNYNCKPDSCPDGWDGLHPTALGEFHIAQAFADVLKESFGFAGNDFAVPDTIPDRDISTPTGVTGYAYPEGNYVYWDSMYNYRGYNIRSRLSGMTDWWSSGRAYPVSHAALFPWVISGQEWEYQVQTIGNADDVSDWTDSIFITTAAETAPPPANIATAPSGDGIQFTWDEVTGYDVNRYVVIILDQDVEGAYVQEYATTGLGIFIDDLVSGHDYSTWVCTWINMESGIEGGIIDAGGIPGSGRSVLVGGGTPSAPTNLVVVNIDATTVYLTWDNMDNAAGYAVYGKSLLDDDSVYGLSGTWSYDYAEVGLLYPGTWHYSFCVTAYNGNLESAMTSCVTPPVYPGYTKRDVVPNYSNTTIVSINGTVTNSTASGLSPSLQTLYTLIAQNVTASTLLS